MPSFLLSLIKEEKTLKQNKNSIPIFFKDFKKESLKDILKFLNISIKNLKEYEKQPLFYINNLHIFI